MEDTWEREPIEGKFTGVPGEPHWERRQPEVRRSLPPVCPLRRARSAPRRWGLAAAHTGLFRWSEAQARLGAGEVPGARCRDLLCEGSFGSLAAVFTQ